jgi:DNA-binding response OmpR family regulator
MEHHRIFDRELDALRDRVLLLGGETETALQRAMYALMERDTPTAEQVLRDADRVTGLDLGADDYITKPFSVRELMARVRAVLRRTDEHAAAVYEDERLQIDYDNMSVTCEGQAVKLTRKEFALLAALARSAGRVGTRQRLLDDVWGHQYYGDQRTLDVHIRRLRHKLGACSECIETVIGIGYRFAGCSTSAGTRVANNAEE